MRLSEWTRMSKVTSMSTQNPTTSEASNTYLVLDGRTTPTQRQCTPVRVHGNRIVAGARLRGLPCEISCALAEC